MKIREGNSSYGTVILLMDGTKVRRGNSSYGTVLMTLDGNKIRQGKQKIKKFFLKLGICSFEKKV